MDYLYINSGGLYHLYVILLSVFCLCIVERAQRTGLNFSSFKLFKGPIVAKQTNFKPHYRSYKRNIPNLIKISQFQKDYNSTFSISILVAYNKEIQNKWQIYFREIDM